MMASLALLSTLVNIALLVTLLSPLVLLVLLVVDWKKRRLW